MRTGIREALVERGFFVAPRYVEGEELDRLAEAYASSESFGGQAYALTRADTRHLARLYPRIYRDLDSINAEGEFNLSHIEGGYFFAIERGIQFDWHQDHESFFLHQTHRSYLNLYIPVIKPVRGQSNLSVVPADRFRARSPEAWTRFEFGGARSVEERDGASIIHDDCHGSAPVVLDFLLDEIAETPELEAGDALFMRGDLFHRTQDVATPRVAMSIRVSDPSQVLTRDHFERSCPKKDWFMAQDPQLYARIRSAFGSRAEISFGELLESMYLRP